MNNFYHKNKNSRTKSSQYLISAPRTSKWSYLHILIECLLFSNFKLLVFQNNFVKALLKWVKHNEKRERNTIREPKLNWLPRVLSMRPALQAAGLGIIQHCCWNDWQTSVSWLKPAILSYLLSVGLFVFLSTNSVLIGYFA